MIQRLLAFVLLSITALSGLASIRVTHSASQVPCTQDHNVWVTQALEQMQTIKPGMTRKDLLEVFTTEGGLSTGLRRTFVSRECLYFKVDVEFESVDRDEEGRVTLVEDSRDIIVNVSRPYLQFAIAD
jgi:hypothetical protein